FFQAEDGIRDFHVTGVQTCALPILTSSAAAVMEVGMTAVNCSIIWSGTLGIANRTLLRKPLRKAAVIIDRLTPNSEKPGTVHGRSEERRVGKGERSDGRRRRDRTTV